MPEPGQAEINLRWAYALIDGLAAGGARQAVISPGSRSTPLVLACDAHPAIRISSLVDERSAAFLALGQARSEQAPVLLIATSGSAPAHWYPAVIEASHSNLPLILLSADRPPELHGWGANQTTDQQRLFGSHLRAFQDPGPASPAPDARQRLHELGRRLAHQAVAPHPGPIQINLPFREPLVPEQAIDLPAPSPVTLPSVKTEPPDQATLQTLCAQVGGQPGLILCGATELGPAFAEAVTQLAQQLGCPLLADPLSNLRFGPHSKRQLIVHYDSFLEAAGESLHPAWILRFGALPVSKALLQMMERSAAPVILCDPYRQWPARAPHTRLVTAADPTRLCQALLSAAPPPASAVWRAQWRRHEQLADELMRAETVDDQPFEGSLIQTLLSRLPAQSLLFSGNSMPIRQLDSWSGSGDQGLRLSANRGVSGIDGNLASFIGMARGVKGAAVALLGDLAFYHDMNSLLAAAGQDLLIILLNNRGGGIFGYLPQARLPAYQAYWNTDTGLDFQHAAALYGLHYRRVSRQSEFEPALERAIGQSGPQLIEVMIDRQFSIERHRYYRQRLRQALSAGAGNLIIG